MGSANQHLISILKKSALTKLINGIYEILLRRIK